MDSAKALLKRVFVTATALSGVFLCLLLIIQPAPQTTAGCYVNGPQCHSTLHEMSVNQDSGSNVSWLSWLTGDSHAGQLHFLNLLELITRQDSAQSSNQPDNQHQQ